MSFLKASFYQRFIFDRNAIYYKISDLLCYNDIDDENEDRDYFTINDKSTNKII